MKKVKGEKFDGKVVGWHVVKDGEKVAESHERRLYTVRLLFLRLDVGI